jgi:hypothetical protein
MHEHKWKIEREWSVHREYIIYTDVCKWQRIYFSLRRNHRELQRERAKIIAPRVTNMDANIDVRYLLHDLLLPPTNANCTLCQCSLHKVAPLAPLRRFNGKLPVHARLE